MSTTPDGRQAAPPSDVEALREEIALTRTELGETVELLAAKADVKARLHDTAEEAKAKVRERVSSAVERTEVVRRNWRPLAAIAGAAVVVLITVRWWSNGRHGSRGRRT